MVRPAAEVQGGVREEQSPDQHGPRGSRDPCCQGGLQEHQQRKQPSARSGTVRNVKNGRSSNAAENTPLILARLQEEVRGDQEQVDLDAQQTRLRQRRQELLAAERREASP